MHALTASQHRISELWSWLPAFRAVAEVQHVQRAARSMHVTASSLSRAVGLLEDRLGRKLFDRVGRNIRLNRDGQVLLDALRDGMRRIDDGAALVTGAVFSGELRVACDGDQPLSIACDAATSLMRQFAGLTTTVLAAPSRSEVVAGLLRGDFDVALIASARADDRVLVEHLADVTYGIYCGLEHSLARRRAVTASAVTGFPFVAPNGDDGGPDDQWPRSVSRNVRLRVPALQPAIALCARGGYLAVLPDFAVLESALRPKLHRLPISIVPPAPLHCVRRHTTGTADRVTAFVDALRARLRDFLAGSTSSKRAAKSPSRPRSVTETATAPRALPHRPAAPSRRASR